MSSCNHLVEALYDKVVRLALLPWPYANPSFDGLRPLLRFREQLCVVTSARHPLATAGAASLAEVGKVAQPFLRLWWNQPSGRQLAALGRLPEPLLEGTSVIRSGRARTTARGAHDEGATSPNVHA